MTGLDVLSGPMMSGSSFPSITGGAAAPSSATADQGDMYVTMNSPFSVAGKGGSASSSANADTGRSLGIDTQTLLIGAVILAAVIIGVSK